MLAAAGCAVDPAIDDGTGEDAAGKTADGSIGGAASTADPNQTFNTQIKPITNAKCVACHGASQPPNLTSYAALQGRFKAGPGNANPLVTKGLHEGPTFSVAEANTVMAWINSLPSPTDSFNSIVKPITNGLCLPCHSGTQAPNLTSYATLEAKYKAKPGATNPLVTKGPHEGPSFTAAQANTIANWVDSLPIDPNVTYENVKPIFTQLCVACHNANLPPNFTSYATLAPKYKTKPGETNLLVTKGAHEGPALTTLQHFAVINWVNSLP